MRFHRTVCAAALALLCPTFFISGDAAACTGIRIKPKDGSVIYARTLEFAADLKSNLVFIPRDKSFVGTTESGEPGLHWHMKYATLGANGFDLPHIVDGLNEEGLAIGLFYFPSYAQYQSVEPEQIDRSLAPWELATYLLGNCSSVQQAIAAIKTIRVGAVAQEQLGFVPPCHYVIHDAQGNCAVLEPVGGELKIHDNPLGVMTNSPTFDWHVTNLTNYVNLSVTNVPPVELTDFRLTGVGQGTGMLGLPGDFSPPSRFVRTVAFSQSAVPSESARDGVLQAFHILNQFDIPKGVSRGVEDGKQSVDFTLWTAASDLKNLRYHFRTFEDSRIRMVELRELDLDAKDVITFSMGGREDIEDLSKRPERSDLPVVRAD